MSKKMFISLAAIISIAMTSVNTAQANYNAVDAVNAGTRIMTQSPVYVDDIGRSHFLSRGGYSSVRKIQNGQAYNNAINETSEIIDSRARVENTYKNAERKVSNTFGEPEEDAFYFPSTEAYFTKVKNNIDTSSNYPAGVNSSKTIYTDDIGRQHFFGKANLIK